MSEAYPDMAAINASEQGATGNEVLEHDAGTGEAQASETQEAVAQEQGSVQNATEQQQPEPPDFIADQWALKFRGKQVLPKTREELLNWAQLGYNHNDRNKALLERERKLEAMAKKYEQLEQLQQNFDSNQPFKTAVFELYKKYLANPQGFMQQAGDAVDEGAATPELKAALQEINSLKEEINGLKGTYQTWQDKQTDEQVSKEISALKEAHPNEDWTTPDENGRTLEYEILVHAEENGFKTLEQAYRDMRFDNIIADTKAQALKEAEEKKRTEARAGNVSRGGGATAAAVNKQPDVRNKTYDQITADIVAGLK